MFLIKIPEFPSIPLISWVAYGTDLFALVLLDLPQEIFPLLIFASQHFVSLLYKEAVEHGTKETMTEFAKRPGLATRLRAKCDGLGSSDIPSLTLTCPGRVKFVPTQAPMRAVSHSLALFSSEKRQGPITHLTVRFLTC